MDLILNIDSIEHTSYKNKAKLLQKQWEIKKYTDQLFIYTKRINIHSIHKQNEKAF
ncbi:hypothetical protein sm9_1977 [Methanobrevibacter millerae]|uniref:Uncharacterized protein n=1 Tax=Methanobrevibacter millerae TaxID=230361 RepID=A0A0U3EMC4_9EURY|nr:hypothetical protein sm9_1977 [Methanobrevibacter millerae]